MKAKKKSDASSTSIDYPSSAGLPAASDDEDEDESAFQDLMPAPLDDSEVEIMAGIAMEAVAKSPGSGLAGSGIRASITEEEAIKIVQGV